MLGEAGGNDQAILSFVVQNEIFYIIVIALKFDSSKSSSFAALAKRKSNSSVSVPLSEIRSRLPDIFIHRIINTTAEYLCILFFKYGLEILQIHHFFVSSTYAALHVFCFACFGTICGLLGLWTLFGNF